MEENEGRMMRRGMEGEKGEEEEPEERKMILGRTEKENGK